VGQVDPYSRKEGAGTLSFFAARANSNAIVESRTAVTGILCLRRHAGRRREAENLSQRVPDFLRRLSRLLCLLGIHDFRILEVRFGFGVGSRIEKVECRRCGLVTSRRSD
jgi:hypothetical protein